MLAAGDGLALRDQLWRRYAEPQRAYHGQQHLLECLAEFAQCRHLALRPAEVCLALWFHDAVYDVQAADNEARSAELAVQALQQAGVDGAAVTRIRNLILATDHRSPPPDADARLLLDVDLAILAAEPARFQEYQQQIRQEYRHVPEAQFQAKRREILTGFLNRPHLYLTPWHQARLEARARENLRAALVEDA